MKCGAHMSTPHKGRKFQISSHKYEAEPGQRSGKGATHIAHAFLLFIFYFTSNDHCTDLKTNIFLWVPDPQSIIGRQQYDLTNYTLTPHQPILCYVLFIFRDGMRV